MVEYTENKNDDIAIAIQNFLDGENSVYLFVLAALKCNGNDLLGIDPFHIHCNQSGCGSYAQFLYSNTLRSCAVY